MRLTRLRVENFGCVQSVDLDLDSDWVVVHGPNDIGKSTLARAVRMALLARINSTVWDQYRPWNSTNQPEVSIDFRLPDEGTTFRVRKSKTSAILQVCAEGSTQFHDDCRDRQVNEKLFTKILQGWGLGDPSSHRGEASSFVANLLFTEQDDVASILSSGTGVDSDKAETAREWLTDVLEAKAIDPAFRDTLEDVLKRCSAYFTPTGQYRRSADSPLRALQEEIEGVRKRKLHLESLWTDMEGVRNELRTKRDQLRAKGEELTSTREDLDRAEIDQKHRAAYERAFEAFQQLQAVAQKIRVGESELEIARGEASQATRACDEAKAAVERAEKEFQKVRDALRALESGNTNADRERQRGELKETLGSLKTEREKLQRQQEQFALVLQRARKQQDALEKRNGKLLDVEQLDSQTTTARARTESIRIRHIVAVRNQCEKRVSEQRAAIDKASEAQRGAKGRIESIETLLNDLNEKGTRLPSSEDLKSLHSLRTDLDIAEGKLDVGLGIELSLLDKRTIRSVVDNESRSSVEADQFQGRAKRTVTLVIEGVGELTIRAGDTDAHEELERLRARWEELSGRIFTSACVEDLMSLQAMVEAHENDVRNATDELLHARSAAPQDQLEQLHEELNELQKALEQARADVPDDLELESESDGDPDELAAELQRSKERFEELDRKLSLALSDLENAEANLREATADSESISPSDVDHARDFCDSYDGRARDLAAKIEATERELQELDGAASTALEEAREAQSGAEEALEKAKADLASAEAVRDQAIRRVSQFEGQLEALRPSFDPEELERRRGHLSALVEPSGAAVAVEELELAVERSERQVKALESEVAKLEGHLQSAMGPSAKEQMKEIGVRLAALEEQEQKLLIDAHGWKLLGDVMKEVEANEAGNLGASLVPILEPRIHQITAPQYRLRLSPTLAGSGSLGTPGGESDLANISVGTREQIATIFRLALAERLRTAVVLDDQLVQSDGDRMKRFLQLLEEISRRAQVIVFTCRPEEYRSANSTFLDLEPLAKGPKLRGPQAPGHAGTDRGQRT